MKLLVSIRLMQLTSELDKGHKVKNSRETTSLQPLENARESALSPPRQNQKSPFFNPKLLVYPQHQQNKTSINQAFFPQLTLAELPPLEVGTRGTVGSLVMQEIKYFSQLELN